MIHTPIMIQLVFNISFIHLFHVNEVNGNHINRSKVQPLWCAYQISRSDTTIVHINPLWYSWYKWRHICTAMQGQLYITWLDNTIASLSNWPWYDRDMLKTCALWVLAKYPICTTFVKNFDLIFCLACCLPIFSVGFIVLIFFSLELLLH